MKKYIGVDIGGTKCAVTLWEKGSETVLLNKIRFDTESCADTLKRIVGEVKSMSEGVSAAGISCGGPLDSEKGVIMSPPNLPDWENVHITHAIEEAAGIPAYIENDANACALAEWRFGVGRGVKNMVFLTFGTGLGAGLILDGRLYRGTNDMAGEIGHIRLEGEGPEGYGKNGSFEGFCSGGGLKQLGGKSAARIAEEAAKGDKEALSVISRSAAYLGRGLAIIIDMLNPEIFVIGSIYARNEKLFKSIAGEEIRREALPGAARACRIVPAKLGDSIGDYGALCVALLGDKDEKFSFYENYPSCIHLEDEIERAIEVITASYKNGGKVLICGNGGSSADSAHIAGELLKGFIKKRPLPSDVKEKLGEMGEKLQCSLPAVDLTAQSGIISAVANDLGAGYVYAQQVIGLGGRGDILIGISTSGNADNVLNAFRAAKEMGIITIGMTGESGGKMAELSDILINVPETETYKVQELHLPVYHLICAAVEQNFFKE